MNFNPQGLKQVNPGGDPALWIFHDTVGDDRVCGLALSRTGGAPEMAGLIVGSDGHTQRVMGDLFRSGELYESATTFLALGALRPGDLAMDIGAHVGYFAILFRLGVGVEGTVMAFEPMPDTYRRLLRNVMANGFSNVLPLPLAMADRSGMATFHLNPDNEGESSLLQSSAGEACQVQVTCLDDLFRDGIRKRPRLIKMDVEGVEMDVLRGGKSFFGKFPPDMVICEINKGALELAGTSEMEVRDFFRERGYRCAVIGISAADSGIDLGGGRFYRYLDAAELAAPNSPYVFNVMFIRDGSGLYPASFQ
jgi:FkbM family methyltransferase